MLIALLVPLVTAALVYFAVLLRAAFRQRALPSPEAVVLGAVTNFFDTLGIGSLAPTMAWLRFRRLVPDRLIASTMLVGLTPAVLVQAIIFIVLLGVLVEPVLLVGCILAVLAGALIGAPLAARLQLWAVQAAAAAALLVAALIYAAVNLDVMPGGGSAAGLPMPWLAVAIAANLLFGVLLNFGIGNYAPTLIMLSLMGMDPKLAFPIMAAGGALGAAAASLRHIGFGEIDLRIATGITLGGIPAVLVAALLVKNMPVATLRWLVIAVVVYAGVGMLRAAVRGRRDTRHAARAGSA